MSSIVLQDILDAIAGTTTVHGGDLNHTVYLQQIRDAILGVSGLIPGSLHEIVYLQQIRNAILGVPDGQFGSLPASIYLQQIVNAYNGVTAEARGNLDEGIYYDEIAEVAVPPTLEYWQRVKSLFGSALAAYYPLDETSGTVANDKSGNGRNGTIVGITLAGATNPITGRPCPVWGGSNGKYVSLSNVLGGVIGLDEGGVALMCSPNSGVRASTTLRQLFYMITAGGAFISLCHAASANRWDSNRHNGTSYDPFNIYNWFYASGWHSVVFTWSKANSIIKCYIQGNQVSSAAISGSLTDAINVALIGASATNAGSWYGNISDVAVVSRYITPAEALLHYYLSGGYNITLGLIGDSVTANQINYAFQIASTYASNRVKIVNHAAAGATIMSQMDGQVTAAATDNANIIILQLGTNDNNAGNMTALQAEVEENIIELKASNPNATLYYMNVLPRWADATTGAEVDKSAIRTAIAAACTAQSITCWDTYTDPWIAQNQTSDGMHPTAAGHAAITARILALLP